MTENKLSKKHIKATSKKMRKWVNLSAIILILLIGLGWGGYQLAYKAWGARWNHLSTNTQQKSYISVLTKAVKANYKPGTIQEIAPVNRISLLTGNYKYQATELVYTSYQNTALYYNNYVSMLQGEISYDQIFNGIVNPVYQTTKASKMVSGYLAQTHDSHFLNYYVGNARIISLPNFQYLTDNYARSASPDLKLLFKAGLAGQQYTPFGRTTVSAPEALKAYDAVTKISAELYKKYPSSKYNADTASLARFYYEAILPTDYSLNLVQSGTKHKLTKTAYKSLLTASKQSSSLQSSIKTYLAHVNKKTLVVQTSYLSKLGSSITTLFGTSVYYETTADLTSLASSSTSTSSSSSSSSTSSSEATSK